MEPLVLEALKWLIPTVLGAVVGVLGATVNGIRKRDRALEGGMTVLLQARIKSDYEHYVVLKEHMTLNDKEMHEQTFRAYEALGGNGVARGMHEEIMATQPWIVTE